MKKKEELQKMSVEYDDIVLAETWLKVADNFSFDCASFNSFRQDRKNREGGGLAFLVRKLYSFNVSEECSVNSPKYQLCGIKIGNLTEPLVIFGCYRPPSNELGRLTGLELDTLVVRTNVSE